MKTVATDNNLCHSQIFSPYPIQLYRVKNSINPFFFVLKIRNSNIFVSLSRPRPSNEHDISCVSVNNEADMLFLVNIQL